MTTRKYNKNKPFRKSRSKKGGNKKEEEDCPICFDKLKKKDNIPKLKCKHKFHKQCLEPVCRQRGNTDVPCPLCRRDISFACASDITRNRPWKYSPHTNPTPYSQHQMMRMTMDERRQHDREIQRHRRNYLARRRRTIARETSAERTAREQREQELETQARQERENYYNGNNSRSPSTSPESYINYDPNSPMFLPQSPDYPPPDWSDDELPRGQFPNYWNSPVNTPPPLTMDDLRTSPNSPSRTPPPLTMDDLRGGNIQRGGKLKLDELKELEKDFEKLGYKLENGRYVLKDTTKPALDEEITHLIESNLFKPHKIESTDFIEKGNLLDCFKSGVKIDDKLAEKLLKNGYKGSIKNKYNRSFEDSKITHPTHFLVKDTDENYILARFKRYHIMGDYGKSNPPPQSTWQYIESLVYRSFTLNLSEPVEIDHEISIDSIESIEYFDIYDRLRKQNEFDRNIEEALPEIDDGKKTVKKVLNDPYLRSEITSYGGKRSIPRKYVPKRLSKKDKKKQLKEIKKSRKAYKNRQYHSRKKVKSFQSKKSGHILNAERIYKVKNVRPGKELAKKTGCSIGSLQKIVKKGQGAYFSSGSRPNQTAHSWGYARLASSITGGKSAAVDFKILNEGCKKTAKAYKLALKSKKKHGYGTRKVSKI